MHTVFYFKYFVKLPCNVTIYSALYTLLLIDTWETALKETGTSMM